MTFESVSVPSDLSPHLTICGVRSPQPPLASPGDLLDPSRGGHACPGIEGGVARLQEQLHHKPDLLEQDVPLVMKLGGWQLRFS